MKNPLQKHMLCIECKKIYATKFFDKEYAYYTIFGILFLIVSYFVELDFFITINPYILFIALFIYIIGSILFLYIFKEEKDCKVCNGKKTLINLDKPEAQEIIQQNNLSIPEES